MTKPNDGGPAFPRPVGGDMDRYWNGEQDGMSLRDWFAGQALAGLLAEKCKDPREAAEQAYDYADEMLEARRPPPKERAS
jgi:hypothetical protein